MSTSNMFSTGKGTEEAITEKGADNIRRVGRTNTKRVRHKLFPGMDMLRGLTQDIPVFVTSDAKMSDVDAGNMTESILIRCNLKIEDDAIMVAFVKAMNLCMAINSSSQLVPGRSKFYVGDSEFDFFKDVMVVLGNDARRYFRAYADITRDYLDDVITEFRAGPRSEDGADLDRYDKVTDMYEAIKFVAEKRGLLRAMNMIADSAEYCTNKTTIETMLVSQSKTTIFATGAYSVNMVDHPTVARTHSSRPPGAQLSNNGANMDGMPNGY